MLGALGSKMALPFYIREFQRIVDEHPEANTHFKQHQMKIYLTYITYRTKRGGACPAARAALKLLWAEEMRRNAGEFERAIRSWGYRTEGI